MIAPSTDAVTANATAPVTNTREAASTFQPGRRAATHATLPTIPHSASTYACGASATAEWMNVPPGTWTADTSALNANRRNA